MMKRGIPRLIDQLIADQFGIAAGINIPSRESGMRPINTSPWIRRDSYRIKQFYPAQVTKPFRCFSPLTDLPPVSGNEDPILIGSPVWAEAVVASIAIVLAMISPKQTRKIRFDILN